MSLQLKPEGVAQYQQVGFILIHRTSKEEFDKDLVQNTEYYF